MRGVCMIHCEHLRADGICKFATELARHDAEANESACKYCSETATPKQGLNKVTVSLAVGACRKSNDKRRMQELIQLHGALLMPERMPTFAERMASFTTAVAGYISQGCPNVPHDAYTKRVETCRTCKEFNGSECRVCGCFIALKAEMQTENCPLGKWEKLK